MVLFEIDQDTNEVKLNKPWLWMVPELNALLKRDKGSPGDFRGEFKVKARKEFTYIYFMVDFASPIRDYAPEEKHKEALYYANLTEKDIDEGVKLALKTYEGLFYKAARSLRTYQALLKTLDAMDAYYENLNFEKTDKKGELLHNPLTVANSVKKLDEMHTAVTNFAKRVEEELSQGPTGIRGAAELGDNEGKKNKDWSEADIAHKSKDNSNGTKGSSYAALGIALNGTTDVKGALTK